MQDAQLVRAVGIAAFVVASLGLGGLARAESQAPANPAGAGHWVTKDVLTRVTVPVYGWVLEGSQTSEVTLSRTALAAGPNDGPSEAGRSFAYSGGEMAGIHARSAQDVAAAVALSHSHDAARAPAAKSGSGGLSSPYSGTWYCQYRGGSDVVVIGSQTVRMAPYDSKGKVELGDAVSFPLSAVNFSGLSADDRLVKMAPAAGSGASLDGAVWLSRQPSGDGEDAQ